MVRRKHDIVVLSKTVLFRESVLKFFLFLKIIVIRRERRILLVFLEVHISLILAFCFFERLEKIIMGIRMVLPIDVNCVFL